MPILHAEVGFDDGFLRLVQPPVWLEDDWHVGTPFLVKLARGGRLVKQVRLSAQAAEDKVAVLAVLFAVGAHMAAHTCIDQCMRGDSANPSMPAGG
ncbi:hypothetical protein D3C79_867680 [compost metagenome]